MFRRDRHTNRIQQKLRKISRLAFRSLPVLWALPTAQPSVGRGTSILVVLTADEKTGSLLRDAQVEIPVRELSRKSDSLGITRFIGLEPGLVRVIARHGGYAPMQTTALLGFSDSTVVVFLMRASAQTLDTVRVNAPRAPEYLRDFNVRKRMGLGHFLTEQQLDSTKHEMLADLVSRRFSGLRASWGGASSVKLVSTRGFYSFGKFKIGKAGCFPLVYIDEMIADPGQLGSLQSGDVGGVEYYSNAPPVQYTRAGAQCGVMLIWTRR